MKEQSNLLCKLEALGHQIFYLTLRCLGLRAANFLLRPVIGFYILTSRKIHRNCAHYLQRRFPQHGAVQRFIDSYRLVLSFGEVLVQRAWLGICPGAKLDRQLIQYERFQKALDTRRGVVLLMGHVGCWQSVLSQLDTLPVPVNVLMDFDDEAAAKHSFQLNQGKLTFSLINVNSPFGGMISAAAALRRGEVVLIMGDRYVGGPSAQANFYGQRVRVPTSAYMLAAKAEAPVVVLFAGKVGAKKFQIKIWDSFCPSYTDRNCRDEVMQDCAQRYLDSLQCYLDEQPYQWYNFYNFWEQ